MPIYGLVLLSCFARLLLQRGWCVTFAASEIVFAEGKRDPEDYIKLDVREPTHMNEVTEKQV